LNLFADTDNDPEHQYVKSTMDRDLGVKDEAEALIDIYRKLRLEILQTWKMPVSLSIIIL